MDRPAPVARVAVARYDARGGTVTRFEYLVVFVENDRVLTANGNWQGLEARDSAGAAESCPSLFEYLEEAGAQGWELVAVDPEDSGTAQLYFKRSHAAR